jgi:hypothetical protein
MKKRWTADEVTRLLREVERDLAKGLTIADVCRKIGIAEERCQRTAPPVNPLQRASTGHCPPPWRSCASGSNRGPGGCPGP